MDTEQFSMTVDGRAEVMGVWGLKKEDLLLPVPGVGAACNRVSRVLSVNDGAGDVIESPEKCALSSFS